MKIAIRRVLLVLVTALVSLGLMTPLSATAAAKPVIYPVSKEYAPKGKKGVIILPYAYCSGTGEYRATIRRAGSSKVTTVAWSFGLKRVSVAAGTYRVSIKATCDGASATKASTVVVRKEKDSNTISRAEFKRIKVGLSLARVKTIVGTEGIDLGGSRYFDRRGSNFHWAEVWFSKGKVAGKSWNAPLGDSGVR